MEYTDYRAYLRDYYASRKGAVGGFSWREFSRGAGYTSPVFLKLVSEGKANLSEAGIERVAQALGLAGRELRYFRVLVAYGQCKNPQSRRELFAEMRQVANQNNGRVLGTSEYEFYDKWYNAALREMLPRVGAISPRELGGLLQPPIPVAEVREALQLLERLGFVRADGEKWVQTDKSITTGTMPATLAVRDLHRQMGELAVDAMDSVPVAERDISGLTIGLSATALHRLREEIADFRRKVVALVSEDAEVERVYRLNLQLFPLSSNLTEIRKNA